MKNVAIILAAGQGKRMNSSVPKQYLLLENRPVLFYSINTMEQSEVIDEIVLVVGNGEVSFVKENFVDKYGFKKVVSIVEGGKERYHSVYNGLQEVKMADYVFIHDGARPFVTEEILKNAYQCVKEEKACVVGVPVKDTIKIADSSAYVADTPDRSFVWSVQTPQVFESALIKDAYAKLIEENVQNVTDDAMVVETMLNMNIKLVMGDYKNIKITTPEDMLVGEVYLKALNM